MVGVKVGCSVVLDCDCVAFVFGLLVWIWICDFGL